MSKKEKEYLDNLYKAVLSLENEKECRIFFEDICTIKEIQDMSHRLECAKMLAEGKVFSYISRATGSSTATISRVNKCLIYGAGGYKLILKRLWGIEKK